MILTYLTHNVARFHTLRRNFESVWERQGRLRNDATQIDINTRSVDGHFNNALLL